MHEGQPKWQEEPDNSGIEFTFDTSEGVVATTLSSHNTIIYQDEECPEMSCIIHSREGEEKPLYLFGQRENTERFIEFLVKKGFKSYDSMSEQELMLISKEYLAWLGSGSAYSNEGPISITTD